MPGLPANDVIIEARGRRGDSRWRPTRDARSLRRRRRRLGARNAVARRRGSLAAAITRAGGLELRSGSRGSRAGARRVRRSARRATGSAISRRSRGRTPPLKSGTYAMVGATIVDGTGRPPIPDGVVVVRDGRIADVGPRASVADSAGVPTVDVDGQDARARPVGHAHARHADRVGAGLSRRRASRPSATWGTSSSSSRRCATRSRRGARSGRGCCWPGSSTAAGRTRSASTTRPRRRKRNRSSAKYHDAGFQQIKIYSLITPPIVEAICAEAHRLGHDGHGPRSQRHDDRAGRRRRAWITSRTWRFAARRDRTR